MKVLLARNKKNRGRECVCDREGAASPWHHAWPRHGSAAGEDALPAGLRAAGPELAPLPSLFPLLRAPGPPALPGEKPGAGAAWGSGFPLPVTAGPRAREARARGRTRRGLGRRQEPR